MKISNSKKQLAKIISENGGWRDGAKFAAQGGNYGHVGFASEAPVRKGKVWDMTRGFAGKFLAGVLLPHWHQTILSRDEYFHLYPAPDAVGEEPEHVCTNPPTIEQLAAEYRNRQDYAERKQQEADDAMAEAEAKLAELVAAGKAVGLVVGVAEPGPVITEYWHLRKGDIISHTRTDGGGDVELSVILTEAEGYDGGLVILAKDYDGVEGWITATGWRFIRRPSKEVNNA